MSHETLQLAKIVFVQKLLIALASILTQSNVWPTIDALCRLLCRDVQCVSF